MFLRLDVTVYDTAVVGVLQCPQDLHDKVHRIFPVEHVFAVDVVFQRNAVNVLHDDILHLVRKAHIVNFYNIRVGHHGDCLGLVAEPPLEFFTLGVFIFENLHGNNTIIQHI